MCLWCCFESRLQAIGLRLYLTNLFCIFQSIIKSNPRSDDAKSAAAIEIQRTWRGFSSRYWIYPILLYWLFCLKIFLYQSITSTTYFMCQYRLNNLLTVYQLKTDSYFVLHYIKWIIQSSVSNAWYMYLF